MREFDICIIGGGPAGCTTAIRLSTLGHSVCLIEAHDFPREHVGICLSDETNGLLDYLGVTKEIGNAGFFGRRQTLVKWGSNKARVTPQPGYHVNRGVFDNILLNKARALGTHVIQPAKVKQIRNIEETWTITYEEDQHKSAVQAKFIVDASGKSNILPGRRKRLSPALTALHGKWSLKRSPEYDGFIEAGEDSWLWFAQTKMDEALITLFTDPKRFSQSTHTNIKEHYRDMLTQFTLLNECQLSEQIGPVKGCDASSRMCDPVGSNYLRVGDANISVDPLASQGVHMAMSSAIQAAVVINTIFNYPANQQLAIQFYRDRQVERAENFTTKTAAAYAQVAKVNEHLFWKERAEHIAIPPPEKIPNPQMPEWNIALQLSQKAELKSIAVLAEDHINSQMALHHPSLKRPVAFLGDQNLSTLLRDLQMANSVHSIHQIWSRRTSAELSRQMISWLWSRGILEEKAKEGVSDLQLHMKP